jgi:Fe-S-cluster containining protein
MAAETTNDASAATDRTCGECRLCCKLLAVDEIDKPPHEWCEHAEPGIGCAIYKDRPAACRTFRCLWLGQQELGPEWQPHKSHLVLYLDGSQLVVNVDPDHKGAWRRTPFREAIHAWAERCLAEGLQVVVKTKRNVVAVLPDREVDLGEVADDEYITESRNRTPNGIGIVARKLPIGERD